jgi:hypothetical protein
MIASNKQAFENWKTANDGVLLLTIARMKYSQRTMFLRERVMLIYLLGSLGELAN